MGFIKAMATVSSLENKYFIPEEMFKKYFGFSDSDISELIDLELIKISEKTDTAGKIIECSEIMFKNIENYSKQIGFFDELIEIVKEINKFSRSFDANLDRDFKPIFKKLERVAIELACLKSAIPNLVMYVKTSNDLKNIASFFKSETH